MSIDQQLSYIYIAHPAHYSVRWDRTSSVRFDGRSSRGAHPSFHRLLRCYSGVQVPPRRRNGTEGAGGRCGCGVGLRRAACRRLVAAAITAAAQAVPRGTFNWNKIVTCAHWFNKFNVVMRLISFCLLTIQSSIKLNTNYTIDIEF